MNAEAIRLFGLGGAGGKIVDAVCAATGGVLPGYALDTEKAALERLTAVTSLLLGETRFNGLGSGGDTAAVRMAASEESARFPALFEGVSCAIFVVGLGGGTGAGLLPELLRAAYDRNVRTMVFSIRPFSFEGTERLRAAGISAQSMAALGDVRFFLSNDDLAGNVPEATVPEAFARATETLSAALTLLWRLLSKPGYLNLSPAMLLSILSAGRGTAELALARGAGEGRSDAVISVLAANRALGLQGRTASVRGALCGILGGADLRLAEVGEMARYIGEQLSPGTAVHLSTVLDEALEGRLEVVLFLFHEWEPMVPDAPAEPLPAPAAAASAPAVSHGTHAFPDDAAWPVSGGGPSDTARELIAQDGKRIQGRFDQTAPIYYRSQQLDEPTWRRRRLSIDFR